MPWLNPTVILVAIAILFSSGGAGYVYGRSAGKAFVQQQWDKQARDAAQAQARYVEAARQQEAQMQEAIDVLQKENKDARKTIVARSTALRDSLRKRPDRDYGAKVPENTTPAVGVSGAELARGDGEFLAGYSADAATVAKAVKQCEAQYEKIQKLYSGEASEDSSQRDKQK